MGWREWLGLTDAASHDAQSEVTSRMAALLNDLPEDRARFLGAFAYHLGRIAHADQTLTESERSLVRTLVARESGLPLDRVDTIVDMALHDSYALRGTEDYRMTREFGDVATHEQKLALIRALFAVSAVDDRVETREDNEIRQIALALRISHDDFIAARAAVRAQLAVLRPNTAS